jgi:hypothetical protein
MEPVMSTFNGTEAQSTGTESGEQDQARTPHGKLCGRNARKTMRAPFARRYLWYFRRQHQGNTEREIKINNNEAEAVKASPAERTWERSSW